MLNKVKLNLRLLLHPPTPHPTHTQLYLLHPGSTGPLQDPILSLLLSRILWSSCALKLNQPQFDLLCSRIRYRCTVRRAHESDLTRLSVCGLLVSAPIAPSEVGEQHLPICCRIDQLVFSNRAGTRVNVSLISRI